jgi:hypothetical protein
MQVVLMRNPCGNKNNQNVFELARASAVYLFSFCELHQIQLSFLKPFSLTMMVGQNKLERFSLAIPFSLVSSQRLANGLTNIDLPKKLCSGKHFCLF